MVTTSQAIEPQEGQTLESSDLPEPWEGAARPPRAWQLDALPLVLDALDRRVNGVVSAFMGSGKSVLATEVLHQRLQVLGPDEVLVVGAPRRRLVRQLSATIAERCGADNVGSFFTDAKEADRRIVVACYASARNLAEALTEAGRTVALLLCDECHQTEADTVLEAFEALQPDRAVGFTATPFRSDSSETLSRFDEVLVRYTYADALRDGVVTSFEVVNWDGDGDGEVDALCLEQIRSCTKGPGIVSALSIADAEDYADYLNANGVKAAAIHSRLPTAEQDKLISKLRRGRLRCLVHVALLAEGVDFPWLRWIALRRPVGSVVRFVQELGRVLRVHPGKTHATVIDPHDLLGIHGIARPAALGEALLGADPLDASEDDDEAAGRDGREMPQATAVGGAARYLRRMQQALVVAGLPERPKFETANTGWHEHGATDRQVAMVQSNQWVADLLPDAHRDAVLGLCWGRAVRSMPKAAVSSLIELLITIKEPWKVWRDGPTYERGAQYKLPGADWPSVPASAVRRLAELGAQLSEPYRSMRRGQPSWPAPSRDWLRKVPSAYRTWVSRVFGEQIRAGGMGTRLQPVQLCRLVGTELRRRMDEPKGKRLARSGTVLDAMNCHPQAVLAFAAERLEYAKMTKEQRSERWRQRSK